jgi:hypothetical protein
MPGHNLAFYPGQRIEGGTTVSQELPDGGAAGEVLIKLSAANGDVGWANIVAQIPATSLVPAGGTNGMVLTRGVGNSSSFQNPAAPPANQLLPTGGGSNDVLTKMSPANFDSAWQPIPPPPPFAEGVESEARIAGPSYEEFDALKAKIEELERKLASLTARRRTS